MAPEHIHYPYTAPEERPATTGSDHRHWGISAFHHWDHDSNMIDAVSVEVEALTEQDAILRAMDIIQRPYYRVNWVKEVCSSDEALKR